MRRSSSGLALSLGLVAFGCGPRVEGVPAGATESEGSEPGSTTDVQDPTTVSPEETTGPDVGDEAGSTTETTEGEPPAWHEPRVLVSFTWDDAPTGTFGLSNFVVAGDYLHVGIFDWAGGHTQHRVFDKATGEAITIIDQAGGLGVSAAYVYSAGRWKDDGGAQPEAALYRMAYDGSEVIELMTLPFGWPQVVMGLPDGAIVARMGQSGWYDLYQAHEESVEIVPLGNHHLGNPRWLFDFGRILMFNNQTYVLSEVQLEPFSLQTLLELDAGAFSMVSNEAYLFLNGSAGVVRVDKQSLQPTVVSEGATTVADERNVVWLRSSTLTVGDADGEYAHAYPVWTDRESIIGLAMDDEAVYFVTQYNEEVATIKRLDRP